MTNIQNDLHVAVGTGVGQRNLHHLHNLNIRVIALK